MYHNKGKFLFPSDFTASTGVRWVVLNIGRTGLTDKSLLTVKERRSCKKTFAKFIQTSIVLISILPKQTLKTLPAQGSALFSNSGILRTSRNSTVQVEKKVTAEQPFIIQNAARSQNAATWK